MCLCLEVCLSAGISQQGISQQGNRRLHFARAVHPVTPFSPIGDAACRQHAGGGPSHGHRQHVPEAARTTNSQQTRR